MPGNRQERTGNSRKQHTSSAENSQERTGNSRQQAGNNTHPVQKTAENSRKQLLKTGIAWKDC
ncbi:MAG TPA: hypothetical protein O0X97_05845 [Methanocorpusculum sp.]|nr:hypothetical protein [Methanocorpusculum sp.]